MYAAFELFVYIFLVILDKWIFILMDLQMKCCGVDGYQDFINAETKDWNQPGGITTAVTVPIVCCVTAPTGTGNTDTNCARAGTLDINEEVNTVLNNHK